MKKYELLTADLTLFEGGDGTAEGPASSGEAETPALTGRGKKEKGEKVLYGKQEIPAEPEAEDTGAADQTVAKTEPTQEDRAKTFHDMITGEYKDLYTAETQKIIDKRFKQTKELEAQADKSRPLLDALALKYGLDSADIEAITNAVNDDNALWQEKADEEGLTVEQYKQIQKMQRETEQLRRQEAARTNEDRANQQLLRWQQESDELKKTFPEFDLNAEAENPQFLSLLRAGVPVGDAYKVIHMDDIVTTAMKSTAAASEKRAVDNIRARGTRPQENGTVSRSGFVVKDDVSKLTRADRMEIARRAERGERISF